MTQRAKRLLSRAPKNPNAPQMAMPHQQVTALNMHPHDICMRIALQQLNTRNLQEVGASFYKAIGHQFQRLTGTNMKQIEQACLDYPMTLPGPTLDIVAMLATLCRQWRYVLNPPLYLFGKRAPDRTTVAQPAAEPMQTITQEDLDRPDPEIDAAVQALMEDEDASFIEREADGAPKIGTVLNVPAGVSPHEVIAKANRNGVTFHLEAEGTGETLQAQTEQTEFEHVNEDEDAQVEAIRQELIARGIDPSTIVPVSVGDMSEPDADGRVELKVTFQGEPGPATDIITQREDGEFMQKISALVKDGCVVTMDGETVLSTRPLTADEAQMLKTADMLPPPSMSAHMVAHDPDAVVQPMPPLSDHVLTLTPASMYAASPSLATCIEETKAAALAIDPKLLNPEGDQA